ncbi:uncharacterized protein [Amphiura filiformis]|uniref:uncharacterized protein isoform X1 n=1 Tax=Amphiura filiformis TaxID=82378 RepID=UPI003B2147B7
MSNMTKFISLLLTATLVLSHILGSNAGCSSNCMRILGAGIGKRKMNIDENRIQDLQSLEDDWDPMTLPLSRQYQETVSNQGDMEDIVRRLSPQWQKQVYELLRMALSESRK